MNEPETVLTETSRRQDLYHAAYEEIERSVARTDPPWLRPIRNAAMTRFTELGFPGPRNEDWKFTNLAPLMKVPFTLPAEGAAQVPAEMIQPFVFAPACQLVFVNGQFCPGHSTIGNLPNGLVIGNFASAIHQHADLVEPHLAHHARYEELALTALNTAFIQDGAFVFARPGAIIDRPIHIVYVTTAPGKPLMTFPRNLLVAGKGSQLQVIESYLGLDEHVYFQNAVTEIVAGENASIDHYKVLRASNRAFHLANLQVYQQRSSRVASQYIALTGGLIRNESRTLLDGEGGECTFNGLYMGRDRQHIDNHTVIDHAKPHCTSHELYKGLLDERARGVFNGKIFVRPDAQKTDAKQTNQVLLLSEDATINTKPQLEIFADDVKCTHGATVGQLDENALFYLRSRGISREQARSLLVYAFANDIVQRIRVEPIRAQLEDVLLTRQHLPHYEEIQA